MSNCKILGYEYIEVIKEFELKPGHKILLFKDDDRTYYPYGILFEDTYNGTSNYEKQRGGAFIYKTIHEAIDEFTSRINHYLKYTSVE